VTEPNKYLGSRRKHYHTSPKAGQIYCDSSYELKATLILDDDENVLFYETQIPYQGEHRGRRLDFLVHLKGGSKKMIEVKPERRIVQFEEQISDAMAYSSEQGYDFEIWTEKELGFESEYFATKWADEYLSEVTPVDFVAIRKELNRKSANKHYKKCIAKDKTTFYCEYCKEEHTVLAVTHKRNIKKNDRFICHNENSHKPKPSKTKKVNPYATEGKKQCVKCEDVKLFEEFGLDKSRIDGYASRCKECRKNIAKQKYRERINNEK